jgi:hypothetical protein
VSGGCSRGNCEIKKAQGKVAEGKEGGRGKRDINAGPSGGVLVFASINHGRERRKTVISSRVSNEIRRRSAWSCLELLGALIIVRASALWERALTTVGVWL